MDGSDHQAERGEGVSIEGLFLELAELPVGERAARLAAIPAPLRVEVESLLTGLEAGAWLEEPLCDPRSSVFGLLADEFDSGGADPEAPERRSIARYSIRRTLGRGGHAVVYLAFETGDLQRWVALKLLLGSRPEAVARFDAERRTLAALEHRGIPRIFDSGADVDGRPWFAMELVRGDWITRWCRERRLPPRERIELFREAVDAVGSAHAAGIVHRDLKPANVMVGEHGGRPQVKVIDFGIARGGSVSGPQAAATDAPGILGSLATMSPEQVRGGADAATERSDVYALGAILFELLADRPSRTIRDRPLGEIVREIGEREPPRLAAVAPGCRGDLDAIVGKAMAFDPRDRYATVAELDADLARYLAGEPVAARVPGPFERAVRWGRRNRRTMAVIGLVLATIVGIATFERSRSLRMAGMREAGRLASLLAEEERLRRDHGAEPERRRLLAEVLTATAPEEGTGLAREERASLRARAIVADCAVDLRPEGDPSAPALLAEAVELRRVEVAARPDDPASLEGLSLALVRRGDTDPDKQEAALRDYLEARSIDERLHREHPSIRRFHDNLVWSHGRIGTALFNVGRMRESRVSFTAMTEEAGRLLASHPGPAVTHHTVGFARYLDGALLAGDGAIDAAVVTLEGSIAEIDAAIRRDPQVTEFHLTRERVASILAEVEMARGRLEAARDVCDLSHESIRFLASYAPDIEPNEPFRSIEVRLLLAEEDLGRGDRSAAAILLDEVESRLREDGRLSRRASMPFLSARIALLRGENEPLERAIRNELGEPVLRDRPRVTSDALIDLVACGRILAEADPDRARRCREAAREIVARFAGVDLEWSVVVEMEAQVALAEERPADALRLLETAIENPRERFNPVRIVERGALLARAREHQASSEHPVRGSGDTIRGQ